LGDSDAVGYGPVRSGVVRCG